MKINITPPKRCSSFYLRYKTRQYMKGEYNKLKAWDIFEGKEKGYYSHIRKNNIQIELISIEDTIINDIEKYLEFLFCNKYIGISFDGICNVPLKIENVQCFYL